MSLDGGDEPAPYTKNRLQGWMLVKSDGKGKTLKRAFKKYFVTVERNSLMIRKGNDTGKPLKHLDLSTSLIAFQNNQKEGEYIRIADADDIFEFKPESGNPKEMNSWKQCMQGLAPKQQQQQQLQSSSRSKALAPPSRSTSSLVPSESSSSLSRGPSVRDPERRRFMEVTVFKTFGEPLGLRICGGTGGDPDRPEIRIQTIKEGSVASKLDLEEGDIIVHINHRKLENVTVKYASSILRKANGPVPVGIARKIDGGRSSVILSKLPSVGDTAATTSNQSPIEEEKGTKDDEEPEESFGFPGSGGSSPASSPPKAAREPEPKPVAPVQPVPTSAESAPEMAPEKAARAEKLAKMRALRESKRNKEKDEIDLILKIIDDLSEDI